MKQASTFARIDVCNTSIQIAQENNVGDYAKIQEKIIVFLFSVINKHIKVETKI